MLSDKSITSAETCWISDVDVYEPGVSLILHPEYRKEYEVVITLSELKNLVKRVEEEQGG